MIAYDPDRRIRCLPDKLSFSASCTCKCPSRARPHESNEQLNSISLELGSSNSQ